MSSSDVNITRAICYIRKSREDEEAEQRGEDTLAKQRNLMEQEVLARYTFAYDIAEEVASGDNIRDRPIFQNILPELGHKYQAIVCKDLSRLGRGSYADMGIVYDIIRDRRIYIITKDNMYDPRNFSDLRMIRFSLFFNREEYEMTLWRLTEGKYDGAKRGLWVAGPVPFGFRYDAQIQRLVPHSEESGVVRLIFSWYVEDGLGYHAIVSRLYQLGVRSPRGKARWHPEVIRRMLSNPAYCGTLAYRKTVRNKTDGKAVDRPASEHIVVKNAFPGIVDAKLWSKTQESLDTHRRKPNVKLDFSPTELAGLLTCTACKKKLVRQSSRSVYRKVDGSLSLYERAYMYCARCGFSIRYADCLRAVLQVLGAMPALKGASLQSHITEQITQQSGAASGESGLNQGLLDAMHTQWLVRQSEIERKLELARDYLLDGTLRKEDFAALRVKFDSELQEILRGLQSIDAQRLNIARRRDANPDWVDRELSSLHTLTDIYSQLTSTNLQNRFLHTIFEEIRLEHTKQTNNHKRCTRFNLHVRFAPSIFQALSN